MTDNSNRLYRSESDKMISGLCGGMAEVYDFDPSLIRIVTLLIVIVTFPLGLIAYFVAALIVPTESEVKGGDQSTLDDVGVGTEDEEESEDE